MFITLINTHSKNISIMYNECNSLASRYIAQIAGAAKYTDCFSEED